MDPNIICRVIRLKGVEISEKHGNDCLERARSFGLEAEFFDAINGMEYKDHLDRLGIRPNETAFAAKKNKPGIYGCFLSHYYLWRECVKKQQPYLILEHDGYMLSPLPSNIVDKFEDVLTLDRHDPYSEIYEDLLVLDLRLKLNIYEHFNHLYKKWKSDETAGNHLRGAYAYIIKPNAAAKIIQWIDANGFLPADHQIGNKIVDIRMVVPSLARLHPAYFGKEEEMSLTKNLETVLANPSSSHLS